MKIIISIAFLLLSHNLLASEAIGFYSNGSLVNAASIDDYSGHYEKLFRSRKRLYATDYLFNFLFDFSEEFIADHPDTEKFQLGDISALNGGKISRHASHQNGLDIDIVYLRVNKRGQDVDYPEWKEYFVKNGAVTKNFDLTKNWELFKLIVSKGDVGRIFVDKAVKKAFCKEYSSSRNKLDLETLRRLRPAKYHLTHFHLRLKCHESFKRCQKQADPANNSGCNELLIESLE